MIIQVPTMPMVQYFAPTAHIFTDNNFVETFVLIFSSK